MNKTGAQRSDSLHSRVCAYPRPRWTRIAVIFVCLLCAWGGSRASAREVLPGQEPVDPRVGMGTSGNHHEDVNPELSEGGAAYERGAVPDFYDEMEWDFRDDEDYLPQALEPETRPSVDAGQERVPVEHDPVMNALRSEYERERAQNASPAAAPADREEPRTQPSGASSVTGSFLRGVAALSLVCALIILLGYGFRKFGVHAPALTGQHLGKHLGKVHLTPRAALHYVQSGDKVLVIGLTQSAITPIAEFPAETFSSVIEPTGQTVSNDKREAFLEQLRAAAQRVESIPDKKVSAVPDEEIAALRGDVQRLHRFIEESGREEL